jgi:hypothetical protein
MTVEDDKSVLGELKRIAILEGFEEETEAFEKRLRQLQVVRCREMRGVFNCQECKVFDYCELAKRVLREHRGF